MPSHKFSIIKLTIIWLDRNLGRGVMKGKFVVIVLRHDVPYVRRYYLPWALRALWAQEVNHLCLKYAHRRQLFDSIVYYCLTANKSRYIWNVKTL